MNKCRFWKNCKLYQLDGSTCNKTGGFYMSASKPSSCYRNQEEMENIKIGLRILYKNESTHKGSIKVMEERLKQLQDD